MPRARTPRPSDGRWPCCGSWSWRTPDPTGTLEELGNPTDLTWAGQVRGSLAGNLSIGFGAMTPLNTGIEWDEVKHNWTVDKHGRSAKDRYGVGAGRCGKPSRYGPMPPASACGGPGPST
ncbi:hypothetical protein [Streptomyces sp. NPDC055210]